MQTKQMSILFSLILATTFMFSCQEPTPEKKDVQPKDEKPGYVLSPEDTISLNKFYTWTNNWKNDGKAFINSQPKFLKYFTMPLVDLQQVLGESPDSARFHLGLRMDTIPNIPHLIVVGVDENGNDMLNYSKGQYAYDVSLPCPPACNNGGNGNIEEK